MSNLICEHCGAVLEEMLIPNGSDDFDEELWCPVCKEIIGE